MFPDPFRLYRRQQRLLREAQEEIQYLRRRHGASALEAAREKLGRPDLTDWGRRVVAEAIRQLQRAPKEHEKGRPPSDDRPSSINA